MILQHSRRWMVAGPEVARTIMEFEDLPRVKTRTADTGTESPHQDVRPAVKIEFMKDVRSIKVKDGFVVRHQSLFS